jgi:hypothetical protein
MVPFGCQWDVALRGGRMGAWVGPGVPLDKLGHIFFGERAAFSSASLRAGLIPCTALSNSVTQGKVAAHFLANPHPGIWHLVGMFSRACTMVTRLVMAYSPTMTPYRRAPNGFTLQMFYGQGHEFPGFSQMIYWGPTRVARVFLMVYWLASAPLPVVVVDHRRLLALAAAVDAVAVGVQPCDGARQVVERQSAKAVFAANQARCLLTGTGAGWGADRPMSSAMSPPAGTPCGGSSGSGVLLALLARLPLALDLSPIDLRRWPLFGHPPHAEVEEALVPGRQVWLGHFRPFPSGLTGPSSSFPAPNKPYFGAKFYLICA